MTLKEFIEYLDDARNGWVKNDEKNNTSLCGYIFVPRDDSQSHHYYYTLVINEINSRIYVFRKHKLKRTISNSEGFDIAKIDEVVNWFKKFKP